MMEKVNGLVVVVSCGVLVISIDVPTLCNAIKAAPSLGNDDGLEPEIVDEEVFANEIARELLAEEEDGSTLVHRMLDRAAEQAIEEGAEGIRLPEDPGYQKAGR